MSRSVKQDYDKARTPEAGNYWKLQAIIRQQIIDKQNKKIDELYETIASLKQRHAEQLLRAFDWAGE